MEHKGTFSIEEAAAYLGISYKTCANGIRSGQIPSIRIGPKRILVPKHALERWLDGERAE